MVKNIKDNSGLTIIEVIISMFIVAMLLIAIVAVFPRMMQHRKGIHEADQAKLVAMEVVERLQMLSNNEYYNNCTNGDAAGTFAFESEVYGRIVAPRPIGAVTYNIKPELRCNDGGINKLDVTVEWDKSGKDHKITVTGVVR